MVESLLSIAQQAVYGGLRIGPCQITIRSAGRNLHRQEPFAQELVQLRVALIVTASGNIAPVAKDVTRIVPIVMAGAGDAVGTGSVASLARPPAT